MPNEPSTKTCRRTILFVDIVSSTALYGYLGDVAARERVGTCMQDLQTVIEGHGGKVVKSLGDGLLVAYEAEPGAVACAFDLVEHAPRHRLRVRVGMHTGEVLEEEDDVFGQAVNTAARISALANPSEILVSNEVYASLPAVLQESARRVPELTVKGVRDPLELYVLVQQDPSATLTITAMRSPGPAAALGGLELVLGDRSYGVGPLANFTMGRGPDNDLVIESPQISRRHAHIANRRGKFILTDQSVNGTWMVPDDGSRMHLVREEGLIHGSGKIFLGIDPDREGARGILYCSRV